ncbi:sensor domain-containing diguanylate cyclase [Nocardioides antri]|uniref:Diguanylate cyclase n=1 Tax=Nocardioides antri TaxID=2607659 RepID=A0A5B1LUU7_9ACTN|nr:GGDEF domain-containing protein [Nocardioides antri]KAA1424184.1 diguanylate cyclase [Nocardioides antri]
MTDNARIERVVDLLARLASGDLSARGVRSDSDDDIDATIEGINMLAEELEASRDTLEQRVQERTAELESVNANVLRLAELGNLLAACETATEAFAMVEHGLKTMFDHLSGAMYLYRASRNILELRTSWGEVDATESMNPRDCWGLRRGHSHFVEMDSATLSCEHVSEQTGDSICIPMSAHGETLGMLHVIGHRTSTTGMVPFTPLQRQLTVLVAEQVSLAFANIGLRERLGIQALRDPLTGLRNRRFADEWIHQEVARGERNDRSLGVIMIDIDHFKRVNDTYGHDAGDAMLKAIAQMLEQALRPQDLPCRYGGEEFLVLVSEVDVTTLHDRAEELRRQVEVLSVEFRRTTLPPVTMSAGVAVYPEHGKTAGEIIEAADAALYAAKRAGRNTTRIAS